MNDKLKMTSAFLVFSLGIAGFYVLGSQPLVLRIISVLVGLLVSLIVFKQSSKGEELFSFIQSVILEAKKVVWPTRKETAQTTGIVVVFVLVMALVLWGIDGVLGSLIRMILGVEG